MLQDLKGAERPERISWGTLTGIDYAHHVPFSNCTWDNTPGVSEMYVSPMLVLRAAMGAAVEESCP
jgi:hypothetical protein